MVCHQTGRPFIEVAEEIVASVRSEIGAVAALKKVYQVPRLPKTRSGKILRKLLRAIVNAEELKIPSTIDDPAIVEEINDIVHPSVKQITS